MPVPAGSGVQRSHPGASSGQPLEGGVWREEWVLGDSGGNWWRKFCARVRVATQPDGHPLMPVGVISQRCLGSGV